MANACFIIGVDYLIVRRHLMVFFAIAAMAASALRIRGTTQGTAASDVEGNTQDRSGRPAMGVENPGAILEFRYVPDRLR